MSDENYIPNIDGLMYYDISGSTLSLDGQIEVGDIPSLQLWLQIKYAENVK